MNDSSNSSGDYGVAAKAYREIKKRIIDRHYAAGQKLSEVRLATELGQAVLLFGLHWRAFKARVGSPFRRKAAHTSAALRNRKSTIY